MEAERQEPLHGCDNQYCVTSSDENLQVPDSVSAHIFCKNVRILIEKMLTLSALGAALGIPSPRLASASTILSSHWLAAALARLLPQTQLSLHFFGSCSSTFPQESGPHSCHLLSTAHVQFDRFLLTAD